MEENRIQKLFEVSMTLSKEKNIVSLIDKILESARELTNADAGTLYLKEGFNLHFKVVQTESLGISIGGKQGEIGWPAVRLYNQDGCENITNISAVSALRKKIITIEDCYSESSYDFSGAKKFDELNNYRTKSMIVIPLKDFEDQVIGVLQLINKIDEKTGEIISFNSFDKDMSVALASQATVLILNTKLLEELETFLERFMRGIGEAVDKKSPYTGNHVKKVSVFSSMVVKAIHKDQGSYKNEVYNKDRIRLLEIAAWLHDIGKISVPDHIIDKATRLELVSDGIHIIGERVEILKRDLKIEFLEKKISDEVYQKKINELESDYKFLQEINNGEIFITDEKLARIHKIAENKYLLGSTKVSILRENDLLNLSIRKGTLTTAERTIVMNHAEMTYKILKDIPFPQKFVEAKHIASNHHEKLNGKGYPRGLAENSLSLDDRILAISDVFEALSSGDRPYKESKTLSQVFKILSFMVKDGDIDGDIVRFIFDSKVYLEYAKQEMKPEQIDEPKLFF